MEKQHIPYMELALDEARKGLGRTSPNPAVGAVIVKDGVVVGRGYHKKAGTPHAEVNALADAGPRAAGATIYVTLEPCNHTGRTPPCTEAILRSGIAKVVIGMTDPNPRVAGGGGQYLASRGIAVYSGVLEQQCRALNYPFIKHTATGRPWVLMKAGLSLDGKITFRQRFGEAITGPEAQRYVHRLRNRVDAILVGVETAIIDNPSLTTRIEGEPEIRDPLRVVLDTALRLPPEARMLHQASAAETWIVCGEDAPKERETRLIDQGGRVCRVAIDGEGRVELSAALCLLGGHNITSLLVEGGARVHGAFYSRRLVDEAVLMYAPFIIGDNGTPLVRGYRLEDGRAHAPFLHDISVELLGSDILVRALTEASRHD
ncbi:MAG: bifunctional diaminohydroxyphosphoribosylaminopyrimidine deaminase/5-amino-6-(5-phosphoribosylamino)uracil reductase RibD [Desulfobulbus sp.]|jgi:diaminohydroxyphosphoribosylaminopyrimidine deaminase/5-amino-6-(5-phosphoribosylamino)uracil reductase|uniref:bifunctional diaminohydroxyphosphoribosylaminopyrimidine deaminase/5-amino-6-(5-phosphoribosylamino)uracil reductase RibD n=1 Tax=Desulfobulbus sp. TaxID=895 RepID=UPI0028452C4D|nr:bifunctional diaminohydroxyphosphoribosylaminopyrimidine deaminase/5-amino-6-(5-phosphoribosylamino)uracil reductase RibD [Desulfobulbus sp.]MDR2550557.1 bifunctional diaminohydroxyphosphoribosylaminopyrimidine deaminase/5-amino-6-(5-phosphoribosylamino)uracil reductase RibD [Desulfobulbus sp.]